MASLNSWALTNLADVKETLGLVDNSKNNLIIRKINQATGMIEKYCGLDNDHHLKQTTYTDEEFDGTGSNDLVVRARPLTAVSSFQVRSSTENISNWDDISSYDYFLKKNAGLITTTFCLTEYPRFYRVSYTAGFSTIPDELAEACVTLAAYLTENGTTGQVIQSKTEGRRSVTYANQNTDKDLFDQLGLSEVLDSYKMPSLAGW